MRLIAVLALLLVACTTPSSQTTLRVPGDPATAVEVVDGDTLVVDVDGVEESVRLIGINAPERDECGYAEASGRLEQLIGGGQVSLVEDISDRDDFGRLLRYVLVDADDVGERLVAEGLAVARAYPPDTDRADTYDAAEDAAKSAGLGLWAANPCGAADAPLRLAGIEPNAPGDDAANPNGEWVEVQNTSDVVVSLDGWGLKDESARHRYTFPPGAEIGPGDVVRVRSGCGTDTGATFHWCADGAVWTNSGDTAFLIDPGGGVAGRLSYP